MFYIKDGRDRVFRGATASHFGDPSDTTDNGVGWQGFPYRTTKTAEAFPGVALPAMVIQEFSLRQFHPV
jgi:hypothetical protein